MCVQQQLKLEEALLYWVSKVTGVADSAPSFCELLSFVLTG